VWPSRCSLSRTISFVLSEGSVNRATGEMHAVETRSIRRSPRLRLQIPVFVRGADASGAEFIELTKTLDISAFGACITCEHALRANQKIHLTIPAPSLLSSGFVPKATPAILDRKSTRLNSSHVAISYAVFC